MAVMVIPVGFIATVVIGTIQAIIDAMFHPIAIEVTGRIHVTERAATIAQGVMVVAICAVIASCAVSYVVVSGDLIRPLIIRVLSNHGWLVSE